MGQKDASTEYQLRKYLLLLATLVATVTYVAGLNLPGGVWQDTQHDHRVGDPILPDTQHRRYLVFYYCNATAFTASLVVCLLLLALEEKSRGHAAALRAVMVLDLLALMGAYAAGSCRDKFTTIYSLLLMSTVFGYIMPALIAFAKSKLAQKGKDKGPDVKQDNGTEENKREEMHEALMLLTTFVITITYVAGLNPPGGFWGSTVGGGDHRVSDPVLQDHHPKRYQAFFICNTTAFVMSLLIVMLLMDKKLTRKFSARFVALYVFIIISLLGLVGAYAAGSSREHDNTTYVIGLGVTVLAYIFLQVFITNTTKIEMKQTALYDAVSKCMQRLFFGGSRGAQHDKALEKSRELIMLLATLVASITYQAGLDPPGGLWQDDQDGHKNGESVLLTTHPIRYKVFFYSNSAAFVASLVVIIMVQSRFLLQRHTLEAAMILDLFGLICAYAAGSCRDVSTSIYVVALAGVVLVYVVIHIIFFTLEQNGNLEDAEINKKREILLLLAILVATLTYQAGLTPPGGFWSANDKSGHYAGYPVLQDNYHQRYKAFFYCNAASFMTSVALILLLVNPTLYRIGIQCYALYVCTVAGMLGIVGAYAAGSSRHLRTSIYVLVLAIGLFAFLTMQVFILYWRKRNGSSRDIEISQPSIQGDGGEDNANKSGVQRSRAADGEIIPSCTGGNQRYPGTGGNATDPMETRKTGDKSCGQGASSNMQSGTSGSMNKGLREYLMLLGVLAASVTYQSGLKPPGGMWQEDKSGHVAGDSILHDINKRRYLAFFYSNSTSFMASIVVIVLLLPSTLHSYHLPLWPMHTAILLDMLGLLAAYAAGSNRDMETTMKVIGLVIPVVAYIAIYPVFSFFRNKRNSKNSGGIINLPQHGNLSYEPGNAMN